MNTYGLTTLTCILSLAKIAVFSPISSTWAIMACNTTSCSCCCQTICSRLMLCWLIVYEGSGIVGNIGDDGDDNNDSGMDGGDF